MTMRIDMHIHTRTGSDGSLDIDEVFREASKRNIGLISITDHDSIECQERAFVLAREYGMSYISGVELNVTFHWPALNKDISLDFLGYNYDIKNQALQGKLRLMGEHRQSRLGRILENLNAEFDKEGISRLSAEDLKAIEETADGVIGRPHIADYLIENGIVKDRQDAFDRYLVKCDVPKYPLPLPEASRLIRDAGGILIHAHPNDPNGTSLVSITSDLQEQTQIIEGYMLQYIDGIECWHSRSDERTTAHYIEFAKKHGMFMTGGSDCHQRPLLLGTLDIPDRVADQFG